MILYVESSAVLAWLLGEPSSGDVRAEMRGASAVVTSDLTLVECDRVLHRAVAVLRIPEASAASLRAHLARAASRWSRLHLSSEILERARRPFPVEPIRALDALHLASALAARSHVPDLSILTLDERVRENAAALGFPVLPNP